MAAVGIDCWAVDYALLDMTTGEIVTEPIAADRDENGANVWITDCHGLSPSGRRRPRIKGVPPTADPAVWPRRSASMVRRNYEIGCGGGAVM